MHTLLFGSPEYGLSWTVCCISMCYCRTSSTQYWWVSARKTNSSALAMELRLSCTNPSINIQPVQQSKGQSQPSPVGRLSLVLSLPSEGKLKYDAIKSTSTWMTWNNCDQGSISQRVYKHKIQILSKIMLLLFNMFNKQCSDLVSILHLQQLSWAKFVTCWLNNYNLNEKKIMIFQ